MNKRIMKDRVKAEKMTLLITGGTGLVGQATIRYLIEETDYGEKPYKLERTNEKVWKFH